MAREKKPELLPSLMDKDKASNSFFMRWSVIIIALMFLTPIGIILLITKVIGIVKENKAAKLANTDKIPFANKKDQRLRTSYGEKMKHYRKKIITVILCSFLFIFCGLYGMTKSVVQMIYAGGITAKKITDFFSFALFVIVGVYFIKSCVDTISQNSRLHRIIALINNKEITDLKLLSKSLSCSVETVKSDVAFMLENAWFGENAYVDKDILHAWSKN